MYVGVEVMYIYKSMHYVYVMCTIEVFMRNFPDYCELVIFGVEKLCNKYVLNFNPNTRKHVQFVSTRGQCSSKVLQPHPDENPGWV